MTIKDLLQLYDAYKGKYGTETYRYISQLMQEAKIIRRRFFLRSASAQKARAKGKTPNHEQSWRAFKGKNLEKLIVHIISQKVSDLGLKIVEGNTLERTNSGNLSKELGMVKRNLLVDYGEFGSHLPDVDIIIYDPKDFKIIAAISSKVTLRERIAQTGYWKIKLSSDEVTKQNEVLLAAS